MVFDESNVNRGETTPGTNSGSFAPKPRSTPAEIGALASFIGSGMIGDAKGDGVEYALPLISYLKAKVLGISLDELRELEPVDYFRQQLVRVRDG